MSDNVAGFFYSPQHAAQQDRSASIWCQSQVCFCGKGAASDGDRTREAEVGDGGRGCGERRAKVSHRSWRRAWATGRGERRAMVSNRGGERRQRKVGVIDKRGCAVSTSGSWLRLRAERGGQWRAKADTSMGGGEVTMVVDNRSSMIMRVPASYSTRNLAVGSEVVFG
jgi:hypothetical protein